MVDYRWNLEVLYPSYESDKFQNDLKELAVQIEDFNQYAAALDSNYAKTLPCIITKLQSVQSLGRKLGAFISLNGSTNTTDKTTKEYSDRFERLGSNMSKATASVNHYIAAIPNMDALIANDPLLAEHTFWLQEIKEKSQYLKSNEVEEVISKLSLTASDAWENLQEYMTSTLEVPFRGKVMTLPQIRNLAYSSDSQERKEAFEAELAAYDKIKDGVCFALNNIKGEVNTICELRGYDSPLDMTLKNSRMSKETLDAMFASIIDYLPKFRAYLRRKGEVLNHPNGLPWYDLFALLGSSTSTFTVEQSKEYLLKQFATFADDLHDMIARAYDEEWIDFLPRKGKVGGAFCANIPPIKQSRILSNFDGSLSDCVTLAHELGHAYHGQQIQNHSTLNTRYSMPVAETASTFNETIVMHAAIHDATSAEEKLMLIESSLQDVTQVIVDIYSRFLFEDAVIKQRETSFLFPQDLEALMIDAQKQAYGDGLDQTTLHPYMWICKSHYYRAGLNYYNFPYAFGSLFARGLYAQYQKEGAAFLPKYRALLTATTIKSVEDVAMMANLDITKRDFWDASLGIISDMIDEFLQLTAK